MNNQDVGRVGDADQATQAPPEAAKASSPSGECPSREGLCQRCRREYRGWSASSPLWNAVVRGGCIKGDEVFEFLCANCFMELAEDHRIAALFRVTAMRSIPLETITPSGMVWNEHDFRWVEPGHGR